MADKPSRIFASAWNVLLVLTHAWHSAQAQDSALTKSSHPLAQAAWAGVSRAGHRLARDVAIKVLPESLAKDADRLRDSNRKREQLPR
jgi:hypothetical protein